MFNIVTMKKRKKKIPSDDESEDMLLCRLCSKKFVSEVALNNHVRMMHIDAFATGDPSIWTILPAKLPDKDEKKNRLEQETRPTSSLAVTGNIMSLASEDVSYIIMKKENGHEPLKKKKSLKQENQKTADTENMDNSRTVERKERKKKCTEPETITGPFECLQPSNLVADGLCHQIFFSCCEYSIHFREEHKRRLKSLRCQVCEKPLLGQDQERPYFCDECGASFRTSEELTGHNAAAHVKLKPYKCSVCDKHFTQQGACKQHMRLHTGDRPFPCTFCTKSFTQKSGLIQHLRLHTKEKPFRCVICNKSFYQSVHLKLHIRTHTNVAPYQCGICKRQFKQSSNLNNHLKTHNPVKVVEKQQNITYDEVMKFSESSELVEVEIDQSQCELLIQSHVSEEVES